jgi:hypothetical protein
VAGTIYPGFQLTGASDTLLDIISSRSITLIIKLALGTVEPHPLVNGITFDADHYYCSS